MAIFIEKWWEMTFHGFEKYLHQKPNNLFVVFYAFFKFNFSKLKRFDNFVIKSVTTDPGIDVFSMVDIVIMCIESYFITEKRIYNAPDNDSVVLGKCNFVLDKCLKSAWSLFLKSVETLKLCVYGV